MSLLHLLLLIKKARVSVRVAFCTRGYENSVTRVPLSTVRARIRAREKRLAVAYGKILKDRREKRGLSVETLSKRTGLTTNRIEKFESGERSPYLAEFFNLARAFRMKAWRLAQLYVDVTDRVRPKMRAKRMEVRS